ncbi:S1 family peptidase [Streptomyces sp. NPDC001744]|uniref:S1 family peptidase n=1 Tax=Streptomyces sp. NPDC001744 TaxID=3364606 RepID=UPI0036ACF51E
MRRSTNRLTAVSLAGAGTLGSVLALAPSASAVVGGTPVADGQRPFVVQIERRAEDGTWSHYCGAVLIDSRVVATAAHCSKFAEQGRETIRVVVGRTDSRAPGGTVVTADRFSVHSHPGFDTTTNTDLGLIVLDSPVSQTPAALPAAGEKPRPGRLVRVAGWGRTDLADETKPTRLREAVLPVQRFDTEGGIWDKEFICAGTAGTRVAPGDSGGPLFETKGHGKAVAYGLVTGETNTCTGLFTNLADPAVWKPFHDVLASRGLGHVIPK